MDIVQNITAIKKRIELAKSRGAYSAKSVGLLAVTKTVDAEAAAIAASCGVLGLGENRVQELLAKQQLLSPDIVWHLIGHLQTNKVRQVVDKIALLHSLDRESLALEVEQRASQHGFILPCLLEINVAAEESKYGLAPSEAADFLDFLADCPHIRPEGLMTVAPYVVNPEEVRPVFSRLRLLLAELNNKLPLKGQMYHLSMGMTNDYEIAVEEGATIVRIGSAIFGPRI